MSKAAEQENPKDKKFVGGYLPWELVILLEEDAESEGRTTSKHLEILTMMGLLARGRDISHLTKVGSHNLDFQMMKEYLEWKAKKNEKS